MSFNELRKDYLLDRWAVIATKRGRRPTDFVKKVREKSKTHVCPLCPGNEHMTPPAVLVYLKSGEGIRKAKDEDGFRHKDWLIRCVPNLYPAFAPPTAKTYKKQVEKGGNPALALGHHEVLVESPIHDAHPADAKISHQVHVVNAQIDRLRELSAKPYVQYVSIFRNHGLEAGASLSHAHSQILAMSFVPTIVREELEASRRFWKRTKSCVFCDILKRERGGPRFVLENSHYMVFTPWASIHPLEFWIFPKNHESSLLEMLQSEVRAFAQTLKACFGGLKALLNDPPYNFAFHLTLDDEARQYYHWHLEVYPRLTIWAGFEKSTGVFINTVAPEAAAESLREAISL